MKRPIFLVVLIDDLRFDGFGAGGHPYMKTPLQSSTAARGGTSVPSPPGRVHSLAT